MLLSIKWSSNVAAVDAAKVAGAIDYTPDKRGLFAVDNLLCMCSSGIETFFLFLFIFVLSSY